ncbi:AMP-binding protein [Streptomyces roseofulvus]|uniref:AMP-binding protein n=1 Tax=Streptomyces roseofulvus TaxID=33902 RepID=UPI0031FBA644
MDSISDPYTYGERIERVVAHHAARTPQAVAIQQDGQTVTYAQLCARAGAIASGLRAAGVGEGDTIPVRLGRSPDLVAALLGVLETGAAYIAMDPGWPAARSALVISQAQAPVVVDAETLPALCAGAPTEPPTGAQLTDGSRAASVFYTSGSTGSPKGVLSPHRGTVRTLVGHPSIPLDASTVFLQAAPLPWDGLSLELWAPLLNGGRCVLLGRDHMALDTAVLRTVVDQGVNSLWLTSSLFNVLSEEDLDAFSRLRLLLVGGERVSPAHVRQVVRAFPGLRIVNGYGPAESTIFTTTHVIRPCDVDEDATEIPIGVPVPRTGVRLIDEAGAVVAPGETGEIAVSGDGLALCYLDDPEATDRAFTVVDGVRHYRTGDLGVLDAEGNLRYRGRADREFKLNGVRIAPGEIESVLERHPRITTCCVVRLEPRPGRPEIGCVFTTKDGEPVPVQEIREHADPHLLPAMLPTRSLHVARLPLGPTGKADQAAARDLLVASLDAAAAASPAGEPTSEDEHAPLWSRVRELFEVSRPGMDEDLFAAGLTSLDAVRLASRLSQYTGRRITVADVYRERTLRRLADGGEGGGRGGTGMAESAIPRRPDEATAPLSKAQQRFWLAEQFSPGHSDHTIVLGYTLHGPLDAARLGRAMLRLVEWHPILRTVYPFEGDDAVQRVLPMEDVSFALETVSCPTGTKDPRELAELVTGDWWDLPYRLESEASLRARLCKVDDGLHVLCLRVHHLAFDGWSESVLLRDLEAAYADSDRGNPQLGVAYADYSRWEQTRLPSWRDHDMPYWSRLLQDPPEPCLPEPRRTDEAARAETVLHVDTATTRALTRAAGQRGGLPVSGLLAAVARAMSQVFGVREVCLGTVTSGRISPEVERIVGYFVNALPIPLKGIPDLSDGDLLDLAARMASQATEHGRTPFDELVRLLRPARGRHPWFQAWVILQQEPARARLGELVECRPVRIRPPRSGFELLLEALPQPDGSWELVLGRREDGMDRVTASTLMASIETALRALATRETKMSPPRL